MSENDNFKDRITERFKEFFNNQYDIKSITELYDDYLLVNNDIVKAIDKLEKLINVEKRVTSEDVEYLVRLDINYSIGHVDKIIIDQHGDEIKKILLDASLIEAYNKSKIFFKNDDINEWTKQLIIYKTTLFKISEPLALDLAIDFLDDVHSCLTDLYNDFNRDYSYNPFRKEFIFESFLTIANNTEDLYDRKQIFVDAISNCEMFCLKFYDFDPEDNDYKKFMFRCHRAIDAIDFKIQNTPEMNINMTKDVEKNINAASVKFRITKNKKTDFIKILSAMYDNRMFETEGGFQASNKQELMNEFGRIVNEDLSNYSVLLSKSKNPEIDIFLKPFDTIRSKAVEYYNKELNQ